MRQSILSLSLCFILALPAYCQRERADEAFRMHHYSDAVRLYESYLKRHQTDSEAALNVAIAHWKVGDLAASEQWFTQAANATDRPEAKLWYGQLLMANEKYKEAAEWMRQYAEEVPAGDASGRAMNMAQYCEVLSRGEVPEGDCTVRRAQFNSAELDFSPAWIGDTLVFVSNRPGSTVREGKRDPWTQSFFTDLYCTIPDTSGVKGEVTKYLEAYATHLHEGPPTYCPQRDELYVTVSVPENLKGREASTSSLKIVRYVRSVDGSWSGPFDFGFHPEGHNMVHPAIALGGQRMFFAADYAGGYGGMDLYYTDRLPNGKWSEPINLGPKINTMGEEMFPSINPEGTFYFASDFHLGFGGLDIYECPLVDGHWLEPRNMGTPINSSRDDFGLAWNPDGMSGYLSSSRHRDSGDDIFHFKMTNTIRVGGQLVDCSLLQPIPLALIRISGPDGFNEVIYTDAEGVFHTKLPIVGSFEFSAEHYLFEAGASCNGRETVQSDAHTPGDLVNISLALSQKDVNESAGTYICGTVMEQRSGSPLAHAVVKIENTCTGERAAVETDANGQFYRSVAPGCEYFLVAEKAGFGYAGRSLYAKSTSERCLSAEFELSRTETVEALIAHPERIEEDLSIELYHVYFDRGEAMLRAHDIRDLENLLALLEEFPSLTGQLEAFTDSRHTAEFNLELSQRRAEAARDWLIERGVAEERLIAKGMGESAILNRCTDGVECSELEHERNRRVEFRVTGFDLTTEIKSREKAQYLELER